MAHLRDVKTSELVYEGTPLEVVLMADELGGAAVIGLDGKVPDGIELVYDDVGLGFDPDAVRTAHETNVAGLADAARTVKGPERDELRDAHAAAVDAGKLGRDDVAGAEAALEQARARLDG